MRKILIALIFMLSAATAHSREINLAVNDYPYTKNKIVIDSDKIPTYAALAAELGLEYGRTYTYTEFANAKRRGGLGKAGSYDFLLLSTGGDSWNPEDANRAAKAPLYWEMVYYKNVNMTVIYAVKKAGSGSLVQLLKLARGKEENLNTQPSQ